MRATRPHLASRSSLCTTPPLTHALKEVGGAALAVAHTPAQAVRLLTYVIKGKL